MAAISYKTEEYISGYRTYKESVIIPPSTVPTEVTIYKYQVKAYLSRYTVQSYRVRYTVKYKCESTGTLYVCFGDSGIDNAEIAITVSDTSEHTETYVRTDIVSSDTKEHDINFSLRCFFVPSSGTKYGPLRDNFSLHLEPAKYYVYFDVNGGSGTLGPENGYAGDPVYTPKTGPTKANTSNNRTITLNAAIAGATIAYGTGTPASTFTIAASFQTGYIFDHWNTKSDGSGDKYYRGQSIVVPEGGITLYAIYDSGPASLSDMVQFRKITASLTGYKLIGLTETQDDEQFILSPEKGLYFPEKNSTTMYAVYAPATQTDSWISFKCPGGMADVGNGTMLYFEGFKDRENDGWYKVKSYSYSSNYVSILLDDEYRAFTKSNRQAADTQNLKIYRDGNVVPEFDYICALNNRLWGCSSAQRTIYASALGDPTDFWRFEGDSLDAWQVAVGSPDAFTGCVAMNNNVLFMKQHTLHKVLGGFPAEYQMYTYDIDGASETNGLSAVNCDGVIIYVSEHGIGTYEGASSGVLSKELGEGNMFHAKAMFDGEKYYLAFKDSNGSTKFYIYDTMYNLWTQQEVTGDVKALAHLGNRDYILEDWDNLGAKIYQINTGKPLLISDEWWFTFRPFLESVSGNWGSRSHIFEKKRYTGITLRVELPENSTMEVWIRADGGREYPAVRMKGKKNKVQDCVIKTPRCDSFEMSFNGTGPMTILAMEREYTIGSRR